MTEDILKKWKEMDPGGRKMYGHVPGSLVSLFYGKSKTNNYWFGVECDVKGLKVKLPDNNFTYLEILVEKESKEFDGESAIRVELKNTDDVNYLKIFKTICDYCFSEVSKIVLEETDNTADEFLFIFTRWLNIHHKSRSKDLSLEKQMGLFGELSFIIKLVESEHFKIDEIIESWIGPNNPPGNQDFKIREHLVELKAQGSGNDEAIKISSEHQLTFSPPQSCFLKCVIVNSISNNHENNLIFSLKKLVSKISDLIGEDIIVKSNFDTLLGEYGYNDEADYCDKEWMIVKEENFKVGSNFPRIVTSGIDPAIRKVRYEIIKSECKEFEINEHELIEGLISSISPKFKTEDIETLAKKDEDGTYEKKATCLFDYARFMHTNERSINKEILFDIASTVAAFMNTDGGNILIGVFDEKEINNYNLQGDDIFFGIDEDIKLKHNNKDKLLEHINTTITDMIGRAASACYSVSFEPYKDKQLCLITVAKNITNKTYHGKEKVFFIRNGSSDKKLLGDEIDTYWKARI